MNIGVITSDPGGAVSFYRVWGPFIALAKRYPEFNFIEVKEIGWRTFSTLDALFMHRCCTKDDLAVMQMANIAGIPVWLDYDDNLLAIPKDNPARDGYLAIDDLASNIMKALAMAKVITCTTREMKYALDKLCDKPIQVIPNALNKNFIKRDVRPRNKVILWRGSKTHVADLYEGIPMAKMLVEKYPEHEWIFIGQDPWMYDFLPKVQSVGGLEPLKYFQLLQGIAPEFMFVPLAGNIFNMAKSNIAWLEGTWAGAKVYASDLPEFNVPGCGSYYSEPDYDKSWGYICSNLLLENVNNARVEILRSIKQ